jgi:predicted permease
MSWMRYRRRAVRDAECAQELESHLAFEIELYEARGMTPGQARTAAHRKLGNTTLIRETVYSMNSLGFLESIWQDVRYGLRTLRKSPGFTAVALASLALGIGANAGLFQLINSVMLRSLPVHDPQQLVRIKWMDNSDLSGEFWGTPGNFTNPQWEQLRQRRAPFSSLFAWCGTPFNIAPAGEIRPIKGLYTSGEFFSSLGVPAVKGRVLNPSDDVRGGPSIAVIGYSFWQREYGGEDSVVGRKISIDGHPFEIVGVTPSWFSGIEVGNRFDVAIPLSAQAVFAEKSFLDNRQSFWLGVFARLKPGITVEQANAYVAAGASSVMQATLHPGWRPDFVKDFLKNKMGAVPGGNGYSDLRNNVSNPLLMLLGIAGLVLLIACANLANLMLARASTRQAELAIRLSLGASRGRVVRQLLSESMLLAVAGCLLGAGLAQVLSRYLIVSFGSSTDSPYLDLSLDWRAFGFMVALAILACLLFGLLPALRATRGNPAAAMKADGRGLTSTRERFGLQRLLVVSQIALSLILVLTSLLFVRSFNNLVTLDPGFRQDGMLAVNAVLNDPVLKKQPAWVFNQMLTQLRHTSGIDAAASVRILPLNGGYWNEMIAIDGASGKEAKGLSKFNRVSENYFRTMGTPLYAGRDFDAHDALSSAEVAVVDQTFADHFFHGKSPLGRTFHLDIGPGETPHRYQIVGLLKNTKYEQLQSDFAPMVFLAMAQELKLDPHMRFMVHSQVSLGPTIAAARKALEGVNKNISVEFHSLPVMAEDSVRRESLMAKLSSLFGILAIVLASIGLYGVKSYIVAQRRHEIGVRLALGADRPAILGMMLRQSGLLLISGLAAGAVIALAAGRAAQSLLFEVKPNDPVTFFLAIAGVSLVSFVASLIPALKAANIPAMAALREQ